MAATSIVEVGTPAPDFVYRAADGGERRLSDAWRERPALVLWLRHFGWQFFAEAIAQLREHITQFESLGVNLALVVQGDAKQAAAFCGRHGLAGRCVADPEKESYGAMGMHRTSWKELIFASDELKARRREGRDAGCGMDFGAAMLGTSDWMQLGGAALMARDGRIVWLHRGTNPGDLPSAKELLQIVSEQVSNLR